MFEDCVSFCNQDIIALRTRTTPASTTEQTLNNKQCSVHFAEHWLKTKLEENTLAGSYCWIERTDIEQAQTPPKYLFWKCFNNWHLLVLRSLRSSNQLLMTISVTMFGVICIHLDTGAGDSTMPNYTILNIHRTGQAPGDGGSFVIFIHQARSGLPWHQYNVWPHPDVSHETNTSQSHLFYQKGDRIT